MSNIQISNDTIFKILVRQGTDSERKNIILDTGELGYSTDTKRIFVGDGINKGGNLSGNVFKGSTTDLTTLSPAEIGDLAFKSDKKELYRLSINDGSNSTDWEKIAAYYTNDNSININANNEISVNVDALSGVVITPLYVRYDGNTDNVLYSKNITNVTYNSIGHYTINYIINSANVIPSVQIFGEDNPDYQPRIINLSNTNCDIKILNLSGDSVDAEIFFSIIR